MDNKTRDKIALFRFGIIAPLVTQSYSEVITSNNHFYVEAAKQKYTNYNGELVKVSPTTISRWYKTYLEGGLDGLKPQRRSDFGNSRKLDVDITEQIKHLKSEHKRIPATMIYEHLIGNGTIKKGDVSLSTITRYINSLNIEKDIPRKEYKRYEKEFCNEVWYGDTCYGPYIKVDGKKMRTYIIAFIDDASRLIVGCNVFFQDNFINVMSVMKSAVKTYGKPKMFSLDNGSPYKNLQMSLVTARIGSILNHNIPYESTGKAKMERWFRTLRDKCLSTTNDIDLKSIDALIIKIGNFVREYNNKVHSSLNGLTPSERFYNDSDVIVRLDNDVIDKSFLLELERKVTKDNIISIFNDQYEVDYRYCNRKIRILFTPDVKKVFVVNEDTNELDELKLLNKIDNSKVKRKKVKLRKEDK